MSYVSNSADTLIGMINGCSETVIREDGRAETRTTGGTLVGNRDDRHLVTVAGSRSGKGRSMIIPNLSNYGGSIVCFDPKGENTNATGLIRRDKLGQTVIVLDPFEITDPKLASLRKTYNPIAALDVNSATLIEDAELIADAVVVSTNTKDAHWDDTAKDFITVVILYVATGFFRPEERNLITVYELIACKRHESMRELYDDMIICGGPDDVVAAGARAMKERGKEEGASVLSNVRKNLKFLRYQSMQNVLKGDNCFSLEDLKSKKISLYLCLPAMRMGTCRQWLRLFVNQTLGAVERCPIQPDIPIKMIIDEMPVLGPMKELETAIGLVAGLGLRIHSIIQDLGQLKSLYKNYETFLGNSGVLQFFGTVDFFTSEWISKYLGKTTLRVQDRADSTLDSLRAGATGFSYRHQVQDLMTPEEVRQFFARDDHMNRQLICIPGKKPMILQRANWDQISS
ncbi:MAG: type IV secretory system conjugative DNA transfer family protein [Opitutales bacterium]